MTVKRATSGSTVSIEPCGYYAGPAGPSDVVTIPCEVYARYVKISGGGMDVGTEEIPCSQEDVLSLCEVHVMGHRRVKHWAT